MPSVGYQTPTPKPPRRTELTIIGAVIIVVGILIVYLLYSSSTASTSVIEVVKPIQAGSAILPSDLQPVGVHVPSNIATIPASEINAFGKAVAAVPLEPGTLLAPSDISGAQTLPKGDMVVGVYLATNHIPVAGVTPGDIVGLWTISTSGSSNTSSTTGGGSGSSSATAGGTPPSSPLNITDVPMGSAFASAQYMGSAKIYDVGGVATSSSPVPNISTLATSSS
jgi:hypothetical protein